MSIKVLVADDSITIQKVIGIIFGGDDYSLTVVDNGKAAVDKAREIIPDILLIDALMPGMSGYEVAEAVRSTPSLATKPILILTGSFEPFDEDKAKKCGADDFISKPFESQQIIMKVKELLELGSSRAATAQLSPPPAPEIISKPAPEAAAPMFEVPVPVFDKIDQVPQPAAQSDIWGAFTPEIEPQIENVNIPLIQPSPNATSNEPDVFAIVSEENDANLMQSDVQVATSPQHTGSQWIPVEENTFEFEDETIIEQPNAVFTDQTFSENTTFGDIAFKDDIATPATATFGITQEQVYSTPETDSSDLTPAFADFAASSPKLEAPSAPFAPLADPIETTPPVIPAFNTSPQIPAALSEEQLKAALTSASREVIERIVWEVVPDLAEALIREAIRKIKEGK